LKIVGALSRVLGFYCMPSEGVELSQDGSLLTNIEVFRLAGLFVKSGVTKIRLTGGEPTVRKGIIELVGMCIIPELVLLTKYEKANSIGLNNTVLSLWP